MEGQGIIMAELLFPRLDISGLGEVGLVSPFNRDSFIVSESYRLENIEPCRTETRYKAFFVLKLVTELITYLCKE